MTPTPTTAPSPRENTYRRMLEDTLEAMKQAETLSRKTSEAATILQFQITAVEEVLTAN